MPRGYNDALSMSEKAARTMRAFFRNRNATAKELAAALGYDPDYVSALVRKAGSTTKGRKGLKEGEQVRL